MDPTHSTQSDCRERTFICGFSNAPFTIKTGLAGVVQIRARPCCSFKPRRLIIPAELATDLVVEKVVLVRHARAFIRNLGKKPSESPDFAEEVEAPGFPRTATDFTELSVGSPVIDLPESELGGDADDEILLVLRNVGPDIVRHIVPTLIGSTRA